MADTGLESPACGVPLRLPTSLDPFAGHLRHDTIVLRTLRLAALLCIGLIPVFGVVVAQAAPGFVDPWWARAALTGAAALLLLATYTSNWVRYHARGVFTVFLTSLVVWFSTLTVLNDLEPVAAFGYIFVYVSVGTMLGLIIDRVDDVWIYSIAGAAASIAVVVMVPEPEFNPTLFILTTISIGFLLFIGTLARIRDRNELAQRQWTLASAEALGDIGSWSYEIATGYRRWSDGMYRLTGAKRREGPPPTVREHLAPEYHSMIDEAERQLVNGEVFTVDHRYPLTRADGTSREIHSIVQLIRSEDRTPLRLIGVMIDVTAQTEYERKLVAARREAEEAVALKSAILANMSHEIRTPLTAVIGFAQILRDEIPADLHGLVIPIETGGMRLLDTLNSVLDLARMEAETAELARDRLDIGELARQSAEDFAPQAEAAGLTFTLATPEPPIHVLADAHAMKRALTHLIGNAVKFTRVGAVTVSVETVGDEAEICVIDTGKGIAPEFMPRLFEAFHQESTGSRRTHEGSGLGLTVTHRLITAMGGTIEAESEPGHGTTFRIRLPLAPAILGASHDGPAWIARGARAQYEAPPSAAPVTAPAQADA